MGEVILHVLGSAQDAGVPQPNCYCVNCTKAMDDPAYKRRAASLGIVFPESGNWHLIDASPDFKEQLVMLQRANGLEGRVMNSIFLTHAHIGHYPGLMYLGKEAMDTRHVKVHAGPLMKEVLQTHVPWRQLSDLGNIGIDVLSDGIPVLLDKGVEMVPFDVPHRNEFSETFGFWINGPNKKVVYIPDIDSWEEWKLDIAEVCAQADICLLDATFFSAGDFAGSGDSGRDLREIPHPFMTETMERLKELTGICDIYFTHFNHSNPALAETGDERNFIEHHGFHLAEDGLTFVI